MSKDGYLPPGCETNMIPGNRPEDLRIEAASEAIEKAYKAGYESGFYIAKDGVSGEKLDEWAQISADGYMESIEGV